VPLAGDGEVTITAPPFNVSPMRAGPDAEPAGPAEAWTATRGVEALAPVTGATIASAAMMLSKAACRLIGVMRWAGDRLISMGAFRLGDSVFGLVLLSVTTFAGGQPRCCRYQSRAAAAAACWSRA
jgi:hypothetical protein